MEYIATTEPVARKLHECFGCLESINIGDAYQRNVHKENGSAFTTKLCVDCVAFLRESDWYDDDGFSIGDLADGKEEWGWESIQ